MFLFDSLPPLADLFTGKLDRAARPPVSGVVHRRGDPKPAGATKPDGTPADAEWAQHYVEEEEGKQRLPENTAPWKGQEAAPDDVDSGAAETHTRRKGAGVERKTEQTLATGDITVEKEDTTSVGLGGGGAKASHKKTTRSGATKPDDGTVGVDDPMSETSSEQSGGVDVARKRVDAKQTWGSKDADGNETERSVGGHADLDGNIGVDGRMATKDEDGKETTVAGGADVDVGPDGRLQGANAHADAEAGGLKLGVEGGIRMSVSEPVRVGERWVVTWRHILEGGVTAGAKGDHLGGDIGVKGSSYELGSRSFATYEEAEAYRDRMDSIGAETGPRATTLEGAFGLAIGESRGEGSSAGASGDLSANIEGADLGVGGEVSESNEIEVRRTSVNMFEVTIANGTGEKGDIAAGGFGVDAKGEASDSQKHSTTVRFDLSTEEGRAAFESYCRTRRMPEKGGELIAVDDAHEHENSDGIDIGAIGGGSHHHRTFENVHDGEDGKVEEYGGEDSAETHYKTLGHWLGGENQTQSFELVGRQENDVDVGYTVSGSFYGEGASGGAANFDALARLTNRGGAKPAEIHSSGTWDVSADLSADRVDDYSDYIEHHADFASGAAHDLQRRLRAAKTSDDKMRAIAAFVAQQGVKAIDKIDDDDRLDFDVELTGAMGAIKDPNFPGRAGRVELETKVEKYRELLEQSGGNGPAALAGLRADLASLRERRAHVADESRYTDLPPELRQAELDKIDGFIGQLTALRDQASVEAVQNRPGESADELEERIGAEESGDAGLPADPVQRQLHVLRDRIAEAQVNRAAFDDDEARAFEALRASARHLKKGGQASPEFATADRLAKLVASQRALLDSQIKEERILFLDAQARDPAGAIAVGERLQSAMEADVGLAAAEATAIHDAARAIRGAIAPQWRKGDFWDELADEETHERDANERNERHK